MRRFDNLKVGDQLMHVYHVHGWRGGVDDFKAPPVHLRSTKTYWLVTDEWFDPCRGQRKREKGELFAIQRIGTDGVPVGSKRPHTRRGLASNGYHYADVDYIGQQHAFMTAVDAGKAVGIGYALAIRQRPKLAGQPL